MNLLQNFTKAGLYGCTKTMEISVIGEGTLQELKNREERINNKE